MRRSSALTVLGRGFAPAVFVLLWAVVSGPALAQPAAMRVAVDASTAAQRYYRVAVTMPVAPGPFTFVYPHWIPGYHGPVGPIESVVNMHVRAGGSELEWRRDLVDMYAVHTDVPAGASSLEVDFDVAGAESRNGQLEPVSTPDLAVVEFSNMVVYPEGARVEQLPVDASLTLPDGWNFGTALPVSRRDGRTIVFAPASLYTVVDSPIIAGKYYQAFPLGGEQELDVAADTPHGLQIDPKILAGMKRLVLEGPALYGSKHYRDYHFLLVVSDSVGGEGIEHHESSDNRSGDAGYLSDPDVFRDGPDLMSHEYSHSWNGKYRRPYDLYQPDYQIPERDDLLWVYEGLNEYNGQILATRSGLDTFADALDGLAQTAAAMDVESGRQWRPIRDTADAAPFLYPAPHQYYDIRRSGGDFYAEGYLIWLDADVTIRRLTNNSKSLDDFEKLWGNGGSTTPSVNPYTADDVYRLLNQVVAYDWKKFFDDRVARIDPHAPLGGITGGGYRLVYTSAQSDLQKLGEKQDKRIDARFSLGLRISTDQASNGEITDVVVNSAAFRAGIAPGMKIVGIDGRTFDGDKFHDVLQSHRGGSEPLVLVTTYDDQLRTFRLDASIGERYPHLERVAGTQDYLSQIYAPHAP